MIFDYLVNFLVHIMPYAHLQYFIGFAFFFFCLIISINHQDCVHGFFFGGKNTNTK